MCRLVRLANAHLWENAVASVSLTKETGNERDIIFSPINEIQFEASETKWTWKGNKENRARCVSEEAKKRGMYKEVTCFYVFLLIPFFPFLYYRLQSFLVCVSVWLVFSVLVLGYAHLYLRSQCPCTQTTRRHGWMKKLRCTPLHTFMAEDNGLQKNSS